MCEPVGVYVYRVHAEALSSQRRVFVDSLKLELKAHASCHMGAGNKAQVFCKSNRCS